MTVVLRGSRTREREPSRRIHLGLRFDEVDDSAQGALNDVEDEDGYTPLLVGVI